MFQQQSTFSKKQFDDGTKQEFIFFMEEEKENNIKITAAESSGTVL